VHRYFTVAFPLHVADEDESLASRLRLASPPPEVLEAVDTMSREHGPIEALVAELVPAWSTVAEDPGRHRELAASLAPARRLAELLGTHLAAEERWIFPAIRTHLAPEVRAAIHEEMRRRRR
jgi:hemerythrin-like domain-containing protein